MWDILTSDSAGRIFFVLFSTDKKFGKRELRDTLHIYYYSLKYTLDRLESYGVILITKKGNKQLVSLNEDNPIVVGLRSAYNYSVKISMAGEI